MHANENHYTVLTSPGRTSPQPGRLFAQHIWLARKDHLFQHLVIFEFLEGLNFGTHPYRHRFVGWHKNSPASVYRSGLLFGAYLWFLHPLATQELFDSKGHTGCILMWVEEFAVHTKLTNWQMRYVAIDIHLSHSFQSSSFANLIISHYVIKSKIHLINIARIANAVHYPTVSH